MIARTFTAMLIGLQPIKIEVEVDGNQGIPHLIFIGLTSQATEEAKERITTALLNCGIRIRSKRTIVNLAPAEVPKSSSGFDLAIAVGLLKMYGEISNDVSDTIFLGELSLDGTLKKIKGALPLALAAKTFGCKKIVLPLENREEVMTLSGITIHPINHLREYIEYCKDPEQVLPILKSLPFSSLEKQKKVLEVDFADIKGQEFAKRALTIAAAGGHHVLLNGPPGTGKSLLAKALISIMPGLTEEEAIDVTSIHSVYNFNHSGLWTSPPFRSPHHTTSASGLIGGGSHIKPGEISLAHKGILFLDEFLEFNKTAIESLRQPLEEGKIFISRASETTSFPADFLLIAATNPCPCGFYQSEKKACTCSPHSREQYRKKLSGPIYDRFDLHVSVQEIEFEKLIEKKRSPVSEIYAQQVLTARQKQQRRYQNTPYKLNSQLPSKHVNEYLPMANTARTLLNEATQKLTLSGRSYFKIIKTARTIADLDIRHHEVILESHIAEALQYR